MVARTLTAALQTAVRSFPVVTVTGPRQSGKTTLLRAAFPGYHYLNLEAVDQRRIAEEDPRGLIGRHLERGIVIDEAQRVPDLFSYVQTIVDEHQTIGKVILSGSQHFLLLERITQSLAGRAMILHLHPFTVLELPAVLGEPVDTVMFSGMYPPLHDRGIAPAACSISPRLPTSWASITRRCERGSRFWRRASWSSCYRRTTETTTSAL